MKTSITKGMNPERMKEITQEFKASAYLRERFIELLNEKIESNRSKTLSIDAYSIPNWAFLQADSVGFERAMKEVISLLSNEKV